MDAAAPPFGGCANPTFQVACDFPGMERIGVRERWQETFVNILDVLVWLPIDEHQVRQFPNLDRA